jgi:hypothetical protein
MILGSCARQAPEQLQSFELGHRVSLGHLVYTAFETQWQPQLGSGPNARVPQNRFLVVRLRVMNAASEEMLVPNLTIEDDQGNSHDELSDGDGVTNWLGFVRRAKPTEAIEGMILFDAPPQHYRLRVTDENSERAAYVQLPLNFGSGSTDLPAPPPAPVTVVPPSPGKK